MNYYYGVDFIVGVKIMEMKVIVNVEFYGGVMVWGEFGVGVVVLFGKLKLVGFVMDVGFLIKVEVIFDKFLLDVK